MQLENAPDTAFGEALGKIEKAGGFQDHTGIQILLIGAVPREGFAAEFFVVLEDPLITREERLIRISDVLCRHLNDEPTSVGFVLQRTGRLIHGPGLLDRSDDELRLAVAHSVSDAG